MSWARHARRQAERERAIEWTAEEMAMIEQHIRLAIADAHAGQEGACIVNDQGVITQASIVREQLNALNPGGFETRLMTPIMLCIEGVARVIQEAAANSSQQALLSPSQYLCTGLDLYTTREPDVM